MEKSKTALMAIPTIEFPEMFRELDQALAYVRCSRWDFEGDNITFDE